MLVERKDLKCSTKLQKRNAEETYKKRKKNSEEWMGYNTLEQKAFTTVSHGISDIFTENSNAQQEIKSAFQNVNNVQFWVIGEPSLSRLLRMPHCHKSIAYVLF